LPDCITKAQKGNAANFFVEVSDAVSRKNRASVAVLDLQLHVARGPRDVGHGFVAAPAIGAAERQLLSHPSGGL
jgi:hypothetical protein